MDDLLNSIDREDTYSWDYVAVFEVVEKSINRDEQLARALKSY